MNLIKKASIVCKTAHNAVDQKRKYTFEPYWEHPHEVADLVMSVDCDKEMIAAALLHDVVEDTGVTLDFIFHEFGDDVGSLIEQLTDISKPEDGNRTIRKQIDLEHTAKASPRAKTIKLADLINNAKTIIKFDPDFAIVFLKEKARLLDVLTEGDAMLLAIARKIVTDFETERLHKKLYTSKTS